MTARAVKPTRVLLRVGLPVLILVSAGVAWSGWRFLTRPLMSLVSTAWVLPAIVAVASVVVFMSRQPGLTKTATAEISEAPEARQSRLGLAAVIVAAGATLSAIALILIAPYWQEHAYSRSIAESTVRQDYHYRAPFVVAEQLANRDLDQVIGDRVGAHAVQTPDQPNQYTSLVLRRGFLQGYEAVQVIHPPLVGSQSSTSTACIMDEGHTLRLGGSAPWNDLSRAISFQRPWSLWQKSDSYGYCDGETPVVVVPLTTLDGFWPVVTQRPDGVAIYARGEVTVYPADAVPAELPGPTYPRSLAATQRESSVAAEGFWDYWFSRAGYDTAGEQESDPNADNAADFTLLNSKGEPRFVTPLTPVGSSESLVALAQVDARQNGPERNPVELYRYPQPRPALSTTENRIRSDFSDLPGWASGMRVMEITPAADDTYVASIGQNQVVTYRVLVTADGSLQVLDKAGDAPEGTPPPVAGEDVATLSTEELQRRIKAYADELAKRAR
ncbi:MAG: hypothetical protein Q3997_03910 [Propionibacteriaceae bacterium]|nr:hypothetical protein [Propionibacteriaceae bacterium]